MFGTTPLIMVEDTATLEAVVEHLRSEPVIAVDTESDSFHHYQEKVCLIQISDRERDYIVDPLKIDDMSSLGAVLTNPDQVKCLHGADYDVVCLKRDYGMGIRNIFDTMIAAQFLGMERIGLADLIRRFFGHTIDKKYQRHDWASRPLEEEHLEYARGDTHFLLALREVMTLRLAAAGRVEHLAEECTFVEEREWGGRGSDPSVDFLRVKGSTGLDDTALRVLRALFLFRDSAARSQDRPTFKIIPDPVLSAVARHQPTDESGLHQLIRPGSPLVRRYGRGLIEAVKVGLADDEPLPDPPPVESRRQGRSSGGAIDRLLGPLKTWRNHVVVSRGLSPVVVANNQLLKEIARMAPKDLDALAAVPGIRDWQLRDFGDELVEIVGSVGDHDAPKQRSSRRRRRRRTGD